MNLAANMSGRVITVGLSILAIPFYLKYLGIEAFGVISIFTSLTVFTSAFDAGLSTTINRQIALLGTKSETSHFLQDQVKTLEVLYWIVAVFVGISIIVSGGWIAEHWLQVGSLDINTLKAALFVMGLALAFQFPISLYTGCLLGLQNHVSLNKINIVFAVIQVVGALAILKFFSQSLVAFFAWYAVVRAVQVISMAYMCWVRLPGSFRAAKFRLGALKGMRRFAGGMGGITVVSILLSQADSLILSRLLPLSEFGAYGLARTIAQGLVILSSPFYSSAFPHFTKLIALDSLDLLRDVYHKVSEMLSIVVIPAALVLCIFSTEVISAWTGEAGLTTGAPAILAVLAVGWGLNALQNAPYALLLAHGRTNFVLGANIAAVLVYIPSVAVLASVYGAIGAAIAWMFFNIAMLCIAVPLMHRRLLQGEASRWFFIDLGRPLIISAAIGCTAWWILGSSEFTRISSFLFVATVYGLALAIMIVFVPWLRRESLRIAIHFKSKL